MTESGDARAHMALRVMALAGVWALGLYVLYLQVVTDTGGVSMPGADSYAYWRAWRAPSLHDLPPNYYGAYLYSPAFAQVLWPLTRLPLEVFQVVMSLASLGMLVWLLRPLGWRWVLPLLVLCADEILLGNINALLALALVVAVRHPWAWAVLVLTKLTTGLPLLWHLFRREWRPLAVAVAVTFAAAAVSAVLGAQLWVDWLRFLLEHRDVGNLWPELRLALAAAVAVWAARTERPWLLAVSLLLTSSILATNKLVVLAAIPRLLAWQRERAADVAATRPASGGQPSA
jgi:hypothetical protein